MKSFRILPMALATLSLAACNSARINGILSDAPDAEVTVQRLDVNKYSTSDTLKTSERGTYKYKMAIKKGQPEFVYLFYGDTRIASLLLQSGDRVKVSSDTIGNYSVTGSAETERLMQVERDEAEFLNAFASYNARLADLDEASPVAAEVRRDMTKLYISYYRSRVQYVMQNYKSLTVIPVLYQNVGDLPIFNQTTDALHFRSAADSLKAIYPDSKYVKALEQEAASRQKLLELRSKLELAGEQGYPDLELPDVNGQKVRLGEVEGKLVMVYFWAAAQADQKMFNLDAMIPLYEKYHPMGFEIFAVSLDTDKTAWATVVKNQKLGWINVCDGLGTASPAVRIYNVTSMPYAYFIKDGELVEGSGVKDEATLKKYVDSIF